MIFNKKPKWEFGKGIIIEGDSRTMSFRQGYNEVEKKYFVQIREMGTDNIIRFWMTKDEFSSLKINQNVIATDNKGKQE